jgi:hypothetical protein
MQRSLGAKARYVVFCVGVSAAISANISQAFAADCLDVAVTEVGPCLPAADRILDTSRAVQVTDTTSSVGRTVEDRTVGDALPRTNVVDLPPVDVDLPPVNELPPAGSLQEILKRLGPDEGGLVIQTLAALGQTVATAGLLASSLTQDIISAALDGDITPDSSGFSPIAVAGASTTSSQFLVSGYKALRHDGFSVSSSFAPASGKTPGFDEDNFGLTVGTRFDGSEFFGTQPGSVTLGAIANYTHTDIEIDAPSGLPGLASGGSADIDSWSAGAFGVVTDGHRYGLLTVTGTYGTPQTSTTIVQPISAEFDNYGLAASAVTGVVIPVAGTTKLDLRGGVNYVYATSDDYQDSLSTSYTDGHMEEFSGSASARLFNVLKNGDYYVRPFIQGGLTHRFHYENELKVDGVEFSFDDADTSVFARAGVDFEVGQSTQAYMAVRGDASEDFHAIAAQVGLTFKLD